MDDRVTIDAEEMALIDRYEAEFKEIPFIAFLDPKTSKKLIREALRSRIPFGIKELKALDALDV
jgi:hypothetical protein